MGLLRVMEAVRAELGEAPIGDLYTAYGQHIHNKQDRAVSADTLLAEVGLPVTFAAAYDDASWDAVIQTAMDEGLALTGNDTGTPIIAFDAADGTRVGFFGPVISRRLPLAQALQMWDGFVAVATVPGFWELKRTRTESPDFTEP